MTQRALIIGISDLRPRARLDPESSVAAMLGLLEHLGGWSVEVLEGPAASREAILAALARLVAATEPDDAVLFYFFGHGGVVRFTDGPGAIGHRLVFYLSASRARGGELSGVLDHELGRALAQIDSTCANVTAILDCCHSGQLVRGKIWEVGAPAWVHALGAIDDPPLLGDDGHPRIVQLAATSSLHYAFARPRGDGQRGLLTEGLVSAFAMVQWAPERLTWDAVAHWTREHAIQARGYEEQWVSLAGPRARLAFSRDQVELPRTLGFVPNSADGGWLRGGALSGVEVGDEWAILDLGLDSRRRPVELARVTVVELDLNRSRVELLESTLAPEALRRGCCARPTNPTDPMRVSVEAGASVELTRARQRELIELIELIEEPQANSRERQESPATCRRAGSQPGTLVALRAHDQLESRELQPDAVLDLLEDWARTRTLEKVLEGAPSILDELPIELRWARCDVHGDVDLPRSGATLRSGERVFFELRHRGLTPEPWYVSVIELDAAGRPVLLNASEPDGRELRSRYPVFVGRRSARERDGIELHWPESLPQRSQPRPVSVIVLMSLRPIMLGHIARVSELLRSVPRESSASDLVRGGAPKPRAPALTHKWAWARIEYSLAPRYRSSKTGSKFRGMDP